MLISLNKNGLRNQLITHKAQIMGCSPAVIDLPGRLAQVSFSIPIAVL